MSKDQLDDAELEKVSGAGDRALSDRKEVGGGGTKGDSIRSDGGSSGGRDGGDDSGSDGGSGGDQTFGDR